jgi:hypothetical protein
MEKHPHAVSQIGLYLVGALEGMARGEYDGNIDRLGDWIQEARRPIFLRVGYEFDLPENQYPPDVYVKAFRRLRDRLDKRGVTNVAYVWHSYAATNSANARDWYPGDDYVDWVAVSFFSVKQPHLESLARFAQERRKPLMIAEATPRGLSTTKGAESWEGWFRPCFAYIARNNVKAFGYINKDWEASPRWQGKGWGDSRLAANDAVKAAWVKEVSGKRYLKASEGLFQSLSPKPKAK